MDILSVFGIILGVTAILLGQFLEGGHADTLINGPALLIVIGGTVGAVMLQSPFAVFMRSIRILVWVFIPPKFNSHAAIEKVVSWSSIARKEGLLGLESIEEDESDPFARKSLQLLIDGSEPEMIRQILEVEIETYENFNIRAARVYESMGGYSPTIGIIGAVMGLIHVMGNLSDPSRLGSGIAVAFVATIYGVGAANLFFLPLANKLRNVILDESRFKEMFVEGVASIAEGENPRNIETKLQGYLH